MASVSLRRLANNLTLSFKLDTRSRTFGLTLTNTERTRRRRDHHTSPLSYHYSQQYARAFSTHPSYRAAVPSAPNATPGNTTSAPRAAPSNYSSRPAAQTTGTPATQTFQRPRDPPPSTARSTAASTPNPSDHPLRELNKGLSDAPPNPTSTTEVDWTSSYHGLSNEAFSSDASAILLAPLNQDDIEIKPDGILYLPEIKYRRILNKAFGPGAWGLAPRGETIVTAKSVTREYALLVHGRFVHLIFSLLTILNSSLHNTTQLQSYKDRKIKLNPTPASSPSPAANKTTSTPKVSLPPPKAASPTP